MKFEEFLVVEMVSMLNQAAIDAVCSATYLDNYLDCVDDLPNELQHIVSSLRELDCLTNGMAFHLPFSNVSISYD